MKIFIVCGVISHYSERYKWKIIAFKNENDAKKFCEECNTFSQTIQEKFPAFHNMRKNDGSNGENYLNDPDDKSYCEDLGININEVKEYFKNSPDEEMIAYYVPQISYYVKSIILK